MRLSSLAELEAAFGRLWADAARGGGDEGEPVLRASVVNLIVVTDGRAAVPEVSRALVDIANAVPGRMIVLAPEPLAADGIDAWPSIQCRALPRAGSGLPESEAPGRAAQVCSEQVTIEVRGAAAGELASIVRPLLEADLPTVLWWRAPLPAERSVLDRLAAEVRTVVVDTARGAAWADGVTPGGDPLAAVTGLLGRRSALYADRPRRAAPPWRIRDLAFARLTPWRERTAALFDLVPCRGMLGRVGSVALAGRPGEPEVRLYVGWLASRLGWRATGPGSPLARTFERPDGGRLTVRVAPVEEGVPLARAAFEGPGARAWVQLGETTPAGALLEAGAAVEGGAPVSQVVTVVPPNEARLVAEEVTMAGDDRVYEAAVQAVFR